MCPTIHTLALLLEDSYILNQRVDTITTYRQVPAMSTKCKCSKPCWRKANQQEIIWKNEVIELKAKNQKDNQE